MAEQYDVTIVPCGRGPIRRRWPRWATRLPTTRTFGLLVLRYRRGQSDYADPQSRLRGGHRSTPGRQHSIQIRSASANTSPAWRWTPTSRSISCALRPRLRPRFEVRTYRLKPGALSRPANYGARRCPAAPLVSPVLAAMTSVTGTVARFLHIWPYRASTSARACARKPSPTASGCSPAARASWPRNSPIFICWLAFSPMK